MTKVYPGWDFSMSGTDKKYYTVVAKKDNKWKVIFISEDNFEVLGEKVPSKNNDFYCIIPEDQEDAEYHSLKGGVAYRYWVVRKDFWHINYYIDDSLQDGELDLTENIWQSQEACYEVVAKNREEANQVMIDAGFTLLEETV